VDCSPSPACTSIYCCRINTHQTIHPTDTSFSSLVYTAPTPPGPSAPEDARRAALHNSDPVHNVNIVAYIRQHLQQAIVDCGGQQTFQDEWLANVDRDVVAVFARLEIL